MAKKTVGITPRPKAKSPSKKDEANAWVAGQGNGKMKRLTIDVSEDLHRRIKMGCASRGVNMADEIRGLLEREFGRE